MVSGCQQKSPSSPVSPATEIPAHFTTYTNKQGLFSISYPSDWELYPITDEEWEYSASKVINSIESDVPLERSHGYHIAGLPETGYIPGVQIEFAPLPEKVVKLDELTDTLVAEVEWDDFRVNTRLKTTIDGREAAIVDYQGIHDSNYRLRVLALVAIRSNKVRYGVACASTVEEFSRWEDDFYHILTSFRILR